MLESHVLPAIGHLMPCDVPSSKIKNILEGLVATTYVTGKTVTRERKYRRETVAKVRGVMHRLFRSAQEDDLVERNPVTPVRTPKVREHAKQRMILTDEEFATFIASPKVDLELRMLSVVARCEGGMRTGDLHLWDWTMIDRLHFAQCTIPRSKTEAPQVLAIPSVLAPFLRVWWEREGQPQGGPVFPVRVGKRAGKRKSPENSYAKRLRRSLFQAGVVRLPPVEVPATKSGTRTDLARRAEGTKLAPNPHESPLLRDGVNAAGRLPHFRRAFNTGLAEADVNVQKAMRLAGHTDPKTHMRYVMQAASMGRIPEAALPQLTPAMARIVTARDDSPEGRIKNPNDSGTPGRIRTCDPRLRRPLLYPAELRAQTRCKIRVAREHFDKER